MLKTFVKGLIAIAIFSVFLQITPAHLWNYLIFLAITISAAGAISLIKKRSVFTLDANGIKVKRFLKRPSMVAYENILDISVSQGLLARRFHCGTVYFILKSGEGSVKVMGGGIAERLEDVPDPDRVYERVSSRLGLFAPSA